LTKARGAWRDVGKCSVRAGVAASGAGRPKHALRARRVWLMGKACEQVWP